MTATSCNPFDIHPYARQLNILTNRTIKQRINDQYLQLQNAEIHESQQLRFFQEIYNIMGQIPHYVNTLKNRNDRAASCL
jgi:hypothetical protein